MYSKAPIKQNQIDKIREDKSFESIGRAFEHQLWIQDKFKINTHDTDDWLELRSTLVNWGYALDAKGPICVLCEPDRDSSREAESAEALVLEVADVRAVLPSEQPTLGTDKERATTKSKPSLQPIVVVFFRIDSPTGLSGVVPAGLPNIMWRLGDLDDKGVAISQCRTTAGETAHFSRLLLHHASLLSPSYVDFVKKDLPDKVRSHLGVSFFVPVHSVELKVANKLSEAPNSSGEAVAKPGRTCSLPDCEAQDCKMMCSKCKSVYYCTAAHSTEDWSTHKLSCLRASKPALFLSRAREAGRALVPLVNPRTDPKMCKQTLFNHATGEMADYDAHILPKNVHGTSSFLVKLQRSDVKSEDWDNVTLLKARGFMIYDRERSFLVQFGTAHMPQQYWGELDMEGFKELHQTVEACERWAGRKGYFRAWRRGDQIEIDYTTLPPQDQAW